MPLEGVDQGGGGLGEEQDEDVDVHLEIFRLQACMKITNHGRDLEEGGDEDEVGKEVVDDLGGIIPSLLPLAEGHLKID